jgi:chorismate synthase
MYMLSRRPRKCSDGSTRRDSSKIRNAEYPVTYRANRPGGLMCRWRPSHASAAARARLKIRSYRKVGWKVAEAA